MFKVEHFGRLGTACVCLLIAALWVLPQQARAQEHQEEEHHDDGHHFHPHHLGLFLGSTTNPDDKSHFTVGIDYVFRFGAEGRWGVSPIAEVIFAEHTEWLFAITGQFRPTESWWLRAGPGVEIIEEEEAGHSSIAAFKAQASEGDKKAKELFRVGTGYDFHVGPVTLAPSLDYDFFRTKTAVVFGLNIGYGW